MLSDIAVWLITGALMALLLHKVIMPHWLDRKVQVVITVATILAGPLGLLFLLGFIFYLLADGC